MINLTETILTNCIIHNVGNPTNDEKLSLSKEELNLNEALELQLRNYFLKPFKTPNETFHFYHETDLKLNEVYTFVDNLFENENIVKNSSSIAKHLFGQTRHHAIKTGDLFVALFDDIILDDVICKGVGIFKSEKKENFFKIREQDKKIGLSIIEGISQNKLDKGCLILNDSYHEGFKIFTYEHNGADTEYWRNDFLKIKIKENEYFQTKTFLTACKEFVRDKLPNEFEVTKAEQIDLLNKSVEYFKKNKEFKTNEFVNDVFEQPEIIKSFKKFKNEFEKEQEINIEDSFSVSAPALKKQAKLFKSVLKLDKNFHIYIHGDRDLIEQGVEKDGRKFYKIYFEEEL